MSEPNFFDQFDPEPEPPEEPGFFRRMGEAVGLVEEEPEPEPPGPVRAAEPDPDANFFDQFDAPGAQPQVLEPTNFFDQPDLEMPQTPGRPAQPPEEVGLGQSVWSYFARGVGSIGTGVMQAVGLMGAPDPQILDFMDTYEAAQTDEERQKIAAMVRSRWDPETKARTAAMMGTSDPMTMSMIQENAGDWMVWQEYLQAEGDPMAQAMVRLKVLDQLAAGMESPAYQAGESFDAWVKANTPVQQYDPEGWEQFVKADVPQGMGSVIGFMVPAAATRGAVGRIAPGLAQSRAGSWALGFAGAAPTGVAVNYSGIFNEAIASGADVATAFKAAEKAGYVGALEGVPIAGFLSRADKATGGAVTRYFKDVAIQGGEEAIQEGLNALLNNLIAQGYYDPDRGWGDDVAHSAGLGMTTGMLLEGLLGLTPWRRKAKLARGEDVEPPPPDPAALIEQRTREAEELAAAEGADELDAKLTGQQVGMATAAELEELTAEERKQMRRDLEVLEEVAIESQRAKDLARQREERQRAVRERIELDERDVARQEAEDVARAEEQAEAAQRYEEGLEEIAAPVREEAFPEPAEAEAPPAEQIFEEREAAEAAQRAEEEELARQQRADQVVEAAREAPSMVDVDLGPTAMQVAMEAAQAVAEARGAPQVAAEDFLDQRGFWRTQFTEITPQSRVTLPEGVEPFSETAPLPQLNKDIKAAPGQNVGRAEEMTYLVEGYEVTIPNQGSHDANRMAALHVFNDKIVSRQPGRKAQMDRIKERIRKGAEAAAERAVADPEAYAAALEERPSAPQAGDIAAARRRIDEAAALTDTAPSDAQVEAGNYKKGHIRLFGMDISIENPKGSIRSSKPGAAKQWSQEMDAHYGYIRRTVGAEGDPVDVFIGDNPESDRVFVIDQIDQQTGKFDEHKVMMGFPNRLAARRGYTRSYEAGWKVGPITEMSVAEFKNWLANSSQRRSASGLVELAQEGEERFEEAVEAERRRGREPVIRYRLEDEYPPGHPLAGMQTEVPPDQRRVQALSERARVAREAAQNRAFAEEDAELRQWVMDIDESRALGQITDAEAMELWRGIGTTYQSLAQREREGEGYDPRRTEELIERLALGRKRTPEEREQFRRDFEEWRKSPAGGQYDGWTVDQLSAEMDRLIKKLAEPDKIFRDPLDDDIKYRLDEESSQMALPAIPPVAPDFYSRMRQTIEKKWPNRVQESQLPDLVAAAVERGDFNESEAEFMDVEGEFATAEGNTTVSKQDILDWMDFRQPDFLEYELMDRPALGPFDSLADADEQIRQYFGNQAWYDRNIVESGGVGNIWSGMTGQGTGTGSWVGDVVRSIVTDDQRRKEYKYFVKPRMEEYLLPEHENALVTDSADYNYRELLFILPEAAGFQSRFTPPHQHWPHPEQRNVLAHARMSEARNTAGEDIMYIQEVQSDWHQAARTSRKGEVERTMERLGISKKEAEDMVPKDYGYLNSNARAIYEAKRELSSSNMPAFEHWIERVLNVPRLDKVEDAPFKKDWPLMVMKRLIARGIKEGKSEIAWATGEDIAKMWNLRGELGLVEYDADSEYLYVYDANGNRLYEGLATIDQVSEILHPSAAERMLKAVNDEKAIKDSYELSENLEDDGWFFVLDANGEIVRDWVGDPVTVPHAEDMKAALYAANGSEQPGWRNIVQDFAADELAIGGEGMISFYDKELVNKVNKYIRKFGSKVTEKQIMLPDENGAAQAVRSAWSFPITEKMRRMIVERGQPMFRVGEEALETRVTAEEAQVALAPLIREIGGMNVEVVGNATELPPQIFNRLQRDNALKAKGFFTDGKVYVLAENHATVEDVERTLLHEGVAHAGLRALLPQQELDVLLDQVWASADLSQLHQRYRHDQWRDQTAAQRATAEEHIAHLAETEPDSGLVKRVVAMVRNALRKMGLDLKWTDDDIYGLLKDTRRALRRVELEAIEVVTPAQVAETGEVIEIGEQADVALRQLDKRTGVVQSLQECLSA